MVKERHGKGERFKIYVDRLENQTQKIEEEVLPEFLDVSDETLQFNSLVHVTGEAYTTGQDLVIHLDLSTNAQLPCTICNEWTHVPIELENVYITSPLSEVKGGKYDFSDHVRDEILLAVPQFVECHGGVCPHRREMKKFLKNMGEKLGHVDPDREIDRYKPFKDL